MVGTIIFTQTVVNFNLMLEGPRWDFPNVLQNFCVSQNDGVSRLNE
jgi:hypothetical protein